MKNTTIVCVSIFSLFNAVNVAKKIGEFIKEDEPAPNTSNNPNTSNTPNTPNTPNASDIPNREEATSKGEVILTYVGKNLQLGIWNPQTRLYTMKKVYNEGPYAGQPQTLAFTNNGQVIDREGNVVGLKQKDGSWHTPLIENVKYQMPYFLIWNSTVIGLVTNTEISVHGFPIIRTSAPMDQDVLTYILFGIHMGPKQIQYFEQKAKEQEQAQAARRSQAYSNSSATNPSTSTPMAANNPQPQQSQNKPAEGSIYNSTGSTIGRFESDGTVRNSSGSTIGRIESNGRVCNGSGSTIGRIESNGTVCNSTNSTIGKIESSGTVCNSTNSTIGKIESDGTVRNSTGSTIGRAPGVPREWVAAYFFFFFN